MVNAVVGSGTLITFPVLLALGYPALTANVSNAVGLVPGLLSGSLAYRAEIRTQPRATIAAFAVASLVGGLCGALLLLALPASAFRAIVPFFIALAVVLILVQPVIRGFVRRRLEERHAAVTRPILFALLLTGIYGGYFGAAQGIILLAVLSFAIPEDIQAANGVKNALNLVTNLVAAVLFVSVAHVAWGAAALIAGGSVVGGQIGARTGRKLPAPALRGLVVLVGAVAIMRLVV